MKECGNKKAQVWIETVIYTSIALLMIGLVLTYAKPKIAEFQDKTILEQSFDMFREIDNTIANMYVSGNQRFVEVGIDKGLLKIDGEGDRLIFEMDSAYVYSQPGENVLDIVGGRIVSLTEKTGSTNKVSFSVDYTEHNVNITYAGNHELKTLGKAPTPYKLLISNNGKNGDDTLIDISLSGYGGGGVSSGGGETGGNEEDCDTCSSLGYNCNSHNDGCGGTIDCGTCSSGLCVEGICFNDEKLLLHFDNDSSYGETFTHVYDFSGNGNNGTWIGGGNSSGTAKIGNYSGFFDGINDYVNVGNSLELRPTSAVTVMAWVKPAAITRGAHFAVSMPYSDGASWSNPWVGYGIGVGYGGGRFWININGVNREFTKGTISVGVWQQIALTFNGTTITGYIDGESVYSTSDYSGSIQYSGTPNLIVGQRSSTAAGEYFNGLVDEVKVWNRSLSSEEIAALYN